MMDSFISENLLTAEEVSGILRIPLPTVYRLTQQSKIKAVKIGKQWRYRKEDVERYLQFGTDFSREPERRTIRQGIASSVAPLLSRNDGLTGFNERRAYPRINTNFDCNYSVNLPPFKVIRHSGIIKNLSVGGVFVVGGVVDIDDPVSLSFVVENSEIKAKGKVVRRTQEGLGIKFKSISKETRDRIAEFSA